LKGAKFSVLATKQIFILLDKYYLCYYPTGITNKDRSTGILYMVRSNLDLEAASKVNNIYQKRWKFEEYHKSIISNTAPEKSPTKTLELSPIISLRLCMRFLDLSF